MSKKTRTKSPKPSSKSSAAKKPVRPAAKAQAKPARAKVTAKPVAKTAVKPKAKAAKPVAKNIVKKTAKTVEAVAAPSKKVVAKESHEPTSKPLKSKPSVTPKPVTPKLESAAAGTEGGKAPAFQLSRDGGDGVSLADYAGQKLVLFFYPRADTPGCTREAIDFTRLQADFAAAGTAVLGVSADSVKALESFRNKHQLGVPLLSDEQHEMLEAYGAWGEKSMYGRSFMGIIRTTVLIGANGRIARTWRNVRVDGHADEVLIAARELMT
jgi:thioredoxin-dependent peroxiredoxin